MSTGACGIACDVCTLRLLDICSSCGPGKSQLAKAKLEAQKRLLGAPCPILACAALRRVDYCLRDCDLFPCENFACGPYPFSQSFLEMQKRRREQRPPALSPYRSLIQIPEQYWDTVQSRDLADLCRLMPGRVYGADGLIFLSFQEEILLDRSQRCLRRWQAGHWEVTSDPQLELVTLLYLTQVTGISPLDQEFISVADLKEAHYFTGPHQLPLETLLERFSHDLPGFQRASRSLSGAPLDLADAAFKFLPLPRVPLYYLFWRGDDEFPPLFKVFVPPRHRNLFFRLRHLALGQPGEFQAAPGSPAGTGGGSLIGSSAVQIYIADLAFLRVIDEFFGRPDYSVFQQFAFTQLHHIQGHPADN